MGLTASLLFGRLMAHGTAVRVAIEAECRERIHMPHDIIENLGRDPKVTFAETEQVLREHNAELAVLELHAKLRDAAKDLESNWWFVEGREKTKVDDLPHQAGPDKARYNLIRRKVWSHVEAAGSSVSKVYIVCHWGVVKMLTGKNVANL